jgi:uncharacterized membrane protein
MEALNVLIPIAAVVVGVLYMMRRKARLKAED